MVITKLRVADPSCLGLERRWRRIFFFGKIFLKCLSLVRLIGGFVNALYTFAHYVCLKNRSSKWTSGWVSHIICLRCSYSFASPFYTIVKKKKKLNIFFVSMNTMRQNYPTIFPIALLIPLLKASLFNDRNCRSFSHIMFWM